MYRLAILAVLVVGCSQAAPRDLRPFVAVAAKYSLMEETQPQPDSDVCRNCRGTGKVGDGKVSVTCPACDGTGKAKR